MWTHGPLMQSLIPQGWGTATLRGWSCASASQAIDAPSRAPNSIKEGPRGPCGTLKGTGPIGRALVRQIFTSRVQAASTGPFLQAWWEGAKIVHEEGSTDFVGGLCWPVGPTDFVGPWGPCGETVLVVARRAHVHMIDLIPQAMQLLLLLLFAQVR